LLSCFSTLLHSLERKIKALHSIAKVHSKNEDHGSDKPEKVALNEDRKGNIFNEVHPDSGFPISF